MPMYDALYARQSIEKKDSISVESQLAYCRYETHGEACIEYTDKGFSGKDTNRPGFEKMMHDMRTGKIKRVIVYKLDRINRSILDFANMNEHQIKNLRGANWSTARISEMLRNPAYVEAYITLKSLGTFNTTPYFNPPVSVKL